MTNTPETIQVPQAIKIQMQMQAYLDRGVGYYIFARKAVALGVMPVGGSLFHIAVEMLLHCGLSAKYKQEELLSKFSKHELPFMWSEFKTTFPDTKLTKFDSFINHHRQWKALRYPNNSGNSSIFFGRTKPDPQVMKQNMEINKSDIQIEINLEAMDEFVTAVVQTIGINPDNIKIHLQHNKELVDLYLNENKYPLFDASVVTNSATFFVQEAKA